MMAGHCCLPPWQRVSEMTFGGNLIVIYNNFFLSTCYVCYKEASDT